MNCSYLTFAWVLLSSVLGYAAAPSAFGFGPDDCWVVVHEDRNNWGCRGDRVPRDVAEAVEKMEQEQIVLGIALNENSWMLIGSKTWSGRNVPEALRKNIQEQQDDGFQVIDAALTRAGGWVVLTRKGGTHRCRWRGRDVPHELIAYLREATDNNHRVLG